MAMTAKKMNYDEGVWKMQYLMMHRNASAEEVEKAWQAYNAKATSVADTEKNTEAEAEFSTNGVSVTL